MASIETSRAEPLSFSAIDIGAVYWSPPFTFETGEAVAFAKAWDPQYYHVDEAAAADSVFGRLSVSGIHSFAVSQLIFNKLWLFRRIGMAGVGMQNFRWRRPVYPGDTVRVRGEITSVTPRDADRAVVTVATELVNQDGIVALRYDLEVLVRTDR